MGMKMRMMRGALWWRRRCCQSCRCDRASIWSIRFCANILEIVQSRVLCSYSCCRDQSNYGPHDSMETITSSAQSSPADCDLEELQVHDVLGVIPEPQLRAASGFGSLLFAHTARRGAERNRYYDLMPMPGSWTPSGTKPRAVTEPRS